jgi:YegS/Rv2252/BmrU family lipid kinase
VSHSTPSPIKTVFLVNPASSNGATGKRWAALAHRAAGLGLVGETLYSERPGHLAELAATVDADVVVAVGGDGTLNEVVNGLMRREERPVLATIPLGTGMDFVRTHGISSAFDDAVRVVAGDNTRTVDVGRVEHSRGTTYLANVGSVGMSGAVAQRVNGMAKPLGGKATYFYALTRVFFEWHNTPIRVELADGTTREGAMHDVIVANGKWHGGAMLLAPDAEPDDGLFDVVTIGDVNKRDFVTTVPKIYNGTYVAHPKVEVLRSSGVAVDAPEPLPIELDGEQVGTTPARFEVVPRAVRVRVP